MDWLLYLLTHDVSQTAAVFGLIVSAAAAATVIWKFALTPAWTVAKHFWNCVVRLEGYMGVLDSIAYEFKPNGGNSIRDVLNRLESYMAVSSTKIQTIMDYHGMAAWESDATGACTWASDELLKLMQMNQAQMAGYGWLAGIRQECREAVNIEWASSITQQRSFQMEYQVGINRSVKVLGKATQVRNARGELTGFIGTLRRIE